MEDNIVQFSSTNESEGSGLREAKRKTARMKWVRLYRIVLLILLAAGLITGYLLYEKTKVFSSYSVTQSVSRNDYDGTKVMEFGGNILTYSKDGASAMDPSGKLLWNQTFDMQNPMISICGDMVAFADYGGSTIYTQKATGEIAAIKTDKPIRKISVSSSEYVVAVLEDTDVTWIYHYNTNGVAIATFRTTMEKSGYPIDVDISPNGELVCVSFYYMDCDDVKSSVAFYNFGSVGQNFVDNYVSGYNYTDTLVPMVRFLTNDTAIAVSSARLSVYSGAHKPVSVSDMFINDDIRSVYYTGDAIVIIYKNISNDAKYRMEVYSIMGEKLSEKKFDFDYSNVSFGNDTVILYGDKNLYIGSYKGSVKFEGEYDEPILLALSTSVMYKYTIVTENTIDTVEFK